MGAKLQVPHADAWSVSEPGWMKCNVDVGVVGAMGVVVSVVCRDDEGGIQGCVVLRQREGWEPRVAEARALLEGARLAK